LPLEIIAGPETEAMREEVVGAVRSALGTRTDAGDWLLTLRRGPGGYLVDLTNRDGVMRQWFFVAGDPIASIIRQGLSVPS
jgi:hypothetical protein